MCAQKRKDSNPVGDAHEIKNQQRRESRKERSAKGLCVDCGRRVDGDGQFIHCKRCRKRRAEYQQVRRIRDRLHGRK